MIYIAYDDGALPCLFVNAKNKKEAKDKALGYYKNMVTDVPKKDIHVIKPSDLFTEDVDDVVELSVQF